MSISVEKLKETKEAQYEHNTKDMSNEEEIDYLNNQLKLLKTGREQINDLKFKKDQLITKHLESFEQPNKPQLKRVNYKALFFYFKTHFIEAHCTELCLNEYSEKLDVSINPEKYQKFESLFGKTNKIKIKMLYTNFPHLIGYKNNDYDNANKMYEKGLNDDFLNKIFYEQNLIEDYTSHGCNIDKILSLSWIWKTLDKPFYVFNMSGINGKNSKLKGKLIFVRIKDKTVHYVSIVENTQDEYVINSQQNITMSKYNDMFIESNAIYKRGKK